MPNENLDAVMQQLAEQMREYNENLSRFARASTSTSSNNERPNFVYTTEEIKRLTSSVSNLKTLKVEELNALKNELHHRNKLTKALEEQIDAEILRHQQVKANSAATVNLIKGFYNLRDTVDDISGDLTKFNGALKGLGDGALELGILYGRKGIILGGTIKALTAFTEVTLKQTNSLLKAFDSLSEIGGTTNITTGQIRELGAAAGYSVANLDKFLKPIKSLGLDIGLLGSTAAQGVQTFSKMAAVGNETYRAFNRLGITQEELTEAQARFIKQSANAGTQLSKSPMALQKASLEYLDTLVQLRDLHGISIKQQQDALDTAKNNDNFNTYMMQKRLQRAEIEKQIENTNDPIVKKQLEERAAEITQIIKNKEAYATYATSTYDAAQAARLLQSISTDGAAIYTESNKELALQDRNLNDLNRTLVTSKDVNAGINLEREQNAKATRQITQNLGLLASGLGSQSTEINKTFGISNEMRNATIRNLEMTTEAGRKRIEEEQAQAKANIERRKKEGEIIDANGNIVRDTAKDVQNVLLTVNREVGTFKDAVIAAVNPFTGSIVGAIAGISAFTYAAVKAAGMLRAISGGMGNLSIPGGTPSGPSGSSGGAGSGRLARIGGFLGKGVLPILGGFMAGSQLSSIEQQEKKGEISNKEATGQKAGTVAGFGLGGAGAAIGAGIGSVLLPGIGTLIGGLLGGALGGGIGYGGGKLIGSALTSDKAKSVAELKIQETATSTTAEGGQKAVNVNIVGSIPLNVNIEKVLDPLFRMAQTSKGTGPSGEPLPPGITVPGVTKSFEQAPATGARGAANTNITIPPIDKSKPFEGSQKEFTDRMQATLLEQAKKLNLPNAEIIARLGTAQSALETGYGKSLAGGNNYFGIKAKPGDTNASVVNTQEYDPKTGQYVTKKAGFRRYGSMEESAEDYIKFLLENPKYKEVLASKSTEEAVRAIQNAGYATDPRYETKLRGIIGRMGGSAPSTAVATASPTSAPSTAVVTASPTSFAPSTAVATASPTSAPSTAVATGASTTAPQTKARPAQRTEEGSYNLGGKMIFYKRTADGKCYIDGKEVSEAEYNALKTAIAKDVAKEASNISSMAGGLGSGFADKFAGAKMAQGGMISGPGTSTSDSVPAFNRDTGQPIALSTGEYVLPASVTSMLGRGYLDSLISSPNTLKRQGGGSIPGEDGQRVISAAVDLGEGMREIIYSDGSRELSGGFGTRFFDPSGKLVKTRTPNFAGLSKDIYADGTEDAHYTAGPLNVSKYASGRTSASYNAGLAKLYADTEQGAAIDIFNEDRTEKITSIDQINALLEQYKSDDNSDLKETLELFKEMFQTLMDKNESLFSEMNSTLKDVVGELETSNSTQEDILNYSRI